MLYTHKQVRLNTWLLGLNPPTGSFAHIPDNGIPVFITTIKAFSENKIRPDSATDLILPENISVIISVDNIDETTKTMWATIISVAPEFSPDSDDEKKFFQTLKGRQIWIKFLN